MTKKSRQKFKYLETKEVLRWKKKYIFYHFIGLSALEDKNLTLKSYDIAYSFMKTNWSNGDLINTCLRLQKTQKVL